MCRSPSRLALLFLFALLLPNAGLCQTAESPVWFLVTDVSCQADDAFAGAAVSDALREGLAGMDGVRLLMPLDLGRIFEAMGLPIEGLSNDDVRAAIKQQGQDFRDNAPMTAAEAATVMLDGVREERWRILVGDDAHLLDETVRANPEAAYDDDFFDLTASMFGTAEE